MQRNVLQFLIRISIDVCEVLFEFCKQVVLNGHTIPLSKQSLLVWFKPVLHRAIFCKGLQAEKYHQIFLCHWMLACAVGLCEPHLGFAEPGLQVVLTFLPAKLEWSVMSGMAGVGIFTITGAAGKSRAGVKKRCSVLGCRCRCAKLTRCCKRSDQWCSRCARCLRGWQLFTNKTGRLSRVFCLLKCGWSLMICRPARSQCGRHRFFAKSVPPPSQLILCLPRDLGSPTASCQPLAACAYVQQKCIAVLTCVGPWINTKGLQSGRCLLGVCPANMTELVQWHTCMCWTSHWRPYRCARGLVPKKQRGQLTPQGGMQAGTCLMLLRRAKVSRWVRVTCCGAPWCPEYPDVHLTRI